MSKYNESQEVFLGGCNKIAAMTSTDVTLIRLICATSFFFSGGFPILMIYLIVSFFFVYPSK
jgi:phage shock protein PspC (stress-responsive transcriptional regulator)